LADFRSCKEPSAWTRLARACNPDVVQGWLYHGNLGATLARAALATANVPLIWGNPQSLSTLQGENLFARIGIILNRSGSGHPDRLLFNSRTSLAQHREMGFRTVRAEYLPNGFQTQNFTAQSRSACPMARRMEYRR